MKKINAVTPYGGRFLVLDFVGESEPRVFDTLLIRDGELAKLNDKDFFDTVFVNQELKTVTWEGELDLDPDVLFEQSIPLTSLFLSHFDVDEVDDARIIVHDCIVSVFDRVPSELEINRIISVLPKDITLLGSRWGWYDTEVREKVYSWLEEEKENTNLHK